MLSGHVDDRDQGRGAFYRLGELAPGDPVAVELADGAGWRYRVRDRRPDAEGRSSPPDEVFARDGAPRLTLVTCGGPFDWAADGYTRKRGGGRAGRSAP